MKEEINGRPSPSSTLSSPGYQDYIYPDPYVSPANPFEEFPKDAIEQSIPSRFESIVDRYPDRLAVKSQCAEWTYDELNKEANRIAHAVLQQRGDDQEPIALILEMGASLIAAILGALKAGKTYVPIDPTYPTDYCRSILVQSGCKLVITIDKNHSLADNLSNKNHLVMNLGSLDPIIPEYNPNLSIVPESPAVILYTSGSTGEPKGVVHSHRNILVAARNYANWFRICPDDRLILCHSCSYAHSVRTFYGGLMCGASIFPYGIIEEGLTFMADWMIGQKITIFRTLPTTFRHFVEALKPDVSFPDIRIFFLGGETVARRDVKTYKEIFRPDCIMAFAIGPTESFTFRRGMIDKKTPICGGIVATGYEVEDMDVYLLDENDRRVEGAGIGEIVVKSRYLSTGYWKRPDLTEKIFERDPSDSEEIIFRTGDLGFFRPDGCLVHVGRKDFQVKIRGFRVELNQIELALLEIDAVKDAIVQPHENKISEHFLVAYIIPANGHSPAASSIRKELVGKLPDYMIPSHYAFLEEFPLTANGKIDRTSLPIREARHVASARDFVAPRNDVESGLAEFWQEVLGVENIGVHDNFFQIGGNSLLAVRLISMMEQQLGIKIGPATIFEAPTIADMAIRLTKGENN